MPTTLLAVDDSVTMRKVLEMTFAGEHDLRVVTADGVDSALIKLRNERPAIVLTDLSLDGQGGYGLCTRIKAESPSTSVIVLASKQQPYDAAKGQAARADDFIEKPFDTQQLIDKVRKLLGRVAAEPARPTTGLQPHAGPPPARSAYASTLVGQPIRPPVAPAPRPSPAQPARHPMPPVTSGSGQVPAAPRFGQSSLSAPHATSSGGPAFTGTGITATGVGPLSTSSSLSTGASSTGASTSAPPLAAGPSAPVAGRSVSSAPIAPSTASTTSSSRFADPPATTATVTAPATAPAAAPAGPSGHAATVASTAAGPLGAAASIAAGANGTLAVRLVDLGLNETQVTAVLALSREVVERVVWEVVPVLAETMIREEIKRLTSEP